MTKHIKANDLSFDIDLFLKNLTERPGVYQMLDKQGDVIYVGKAKNLKNRVSSYFHKGAHDTKTLRMINKIADIKIIVTASENEALLLECNLIKSLRPHYNILLRDDKSYPYIYVSTHDLYPRIDFHRGAKKLPGRYYGPYPNGKSVRQTLHLLQQLFKLRPCQDAYFNHRQRPCLQYQIKRCSAPCVQYIQPSEYQEAVRLAQLFLEGKSQTVIQELQEHMQIASEQQHYEQAAEYRDLILSLRHVQEQQYITQEKADLDVIVITQEQMIYCIELLLLRNGSILGSKSFFPKIPEDSEPHDILQAFISQYYLNHQTEIPSEIILNLAIPDLTWLNSVLNDLAHRKIKISQPQRGKRVRWLTMAEANAKQALQKHNNHKRMIHTRLQRLQIKLALAQLPQRIECFDISHSQGEATMASCVVYDQTGLRHDEYRRFNINDIQAGDDYAALQQAIYRRYHRRLAEQKPLPDILLIDGGKGQVQVANQVLQTLNLSDIMVLGLAKGPTRKIGHEELIFGKTLQAMLVEDDIYAWQVLLELRDEAHRFAITGHRHKRNKARMTSSLEDIAGIGSKRRRELLNYFGGLQALTGASIEEIAKVPGISLAMAQKIYDTFH
ncbi:MAG: excinuclease ABC subunit UvrC [Legionellales bacterium]|nr:excinuclease ABC subunit UvrC [Legionellales bacterium]